MSETVAGSSQPPSRGPSIRKPTPVRVSSTDLVEIRPLRAEGPLPLLVTPREPDTVDLAEWAGRNRPLLDERLLKDGAILFRGFGAMSLPAFEKVVGSLSDDLMNYTEGATPRSELKDKFYTSTEYPPEHSIALHNELSYVATWPMKLWFACVQAAPQGGETPIADVRKVHARLSPAVREMFTERGWMLLRNYGDGLSLPWQKVFRTADRAEVEAYCVDSQVELEWKGDDRLRTRHVRPAVRRHPITGETVWFNHLAFWHISSLEPAELREEFLRQMSEEELPYNTYFGDGAPVPSDVMDELRAAYAAETVAFRWQEGDVIMIDNMLVAHGRNPFAGPRRILAAMGEPRSGREENDAFMQRRKS
jgi:alpha-ketoglutarate-dependent taurine dioxygenase